MRIAVVGGGLAGLGAALELVDAGHEVTVYEARPTLGGAVQTLPRRDGDPEPPPDNGQHIALGCFTEYLRFLDRIGESGALRREPARAAGDRRAGPQWRRSGPPRLALLRYRHVPLGDRLGILRALVHCAAQARRGGTFGEALRRLGQSPAAIERFWDVFIRPALNLAADEASAEVGDSRCEPRCSRGSAARATSFSRCGRSGRCTARRRAARSRRPGATVRTGAPHRRRCDELDADAVVVALPPAESARLLGEPEPAA